MTLDVTIDTTAPTVGGSSPTLAEGGTVDLDGYLSYTDANGGDLTYTLGTVTAGELRLDGVAWGLARPSPRPMWTPVGLCSSMMVRRQRRAM